VRAATQLVAAILVVGLVACGISHRALNVDDPVARYAKNVRTAQKTVERPMYRWRGLHLDVSRHFFSVSVVERYIALVAHYNLNVFHWHLTDDQAWRLQINRYPLLTSSAACSKTACEFYTQDDVRRIVRYAAARNVMVVPEIEMPAHMSAAIRAYPRLGCGRRDVLCAREATLGFVENVISEVLTLFPARFIHAGGDEAPVAAQRYLLPRVESFLRTRGRRMVVWDDAFESGISPGTVITAWHGDRRAIAAIDRGHDVVMVPDGPLYFNAYQGPAAQEPPSAPHTATLEQVYSYDPTPDHLDARQRSRILGVEAAVWTEKIASPQRLFEVVLPRALALGEIASTSPSHKSWNGFLGRLPAQLSWLQRNNYPFRIPLPIIAVSGSRSRFHSIVGNIAGAVAVTDASTVTVTMREPVNGAVVRYTLDGAFPSAHSPRYVKPLRIRLDQLAERTLLAAAFDQDGRESEWSEVIIKRVSSAALNREGGSRAWASVVSP